MYGTEIKATLQDYSSCPVDEKHERQQRLQIKLTGDLDPELFSDIDAEVKLDAVRCNEGRKEAVSYPMRRLAAMSLSAEDGDRTFPQCELTSMSFKRPAKNAPMGTWALVVAFEWDDDDLLFVAHAHRLTAAVTLTKLAEPQEAQVTIDEAVAAKNGGE